MSRPTKDDAVWAVAIILSLPLIVACLPLMLCCTAVERLRGERGRRRPPIGARGRGHELGGGSRWRAIQDGPVGPPLAGRHVELSDVAKTNGENDD